VARKINPLPMQQLCADAHGNMLVVGEPGSGCTTALLMAATKYADASDWSAIVFAAARPNLSGLVKVAKKVVAGTGARFIQSTNTFVFPSGATLSLDVADHPAKDRFLGSSFSFVGFNQLELFDKPTVRALASRARERLTYSLPMAWWRRVLSAVWILKPQTIEVHPRVCAISSGPEKTRPTFEWADEIFATRVHLRTDDNPHLDNETREFIRAHAQYT
jgi:hypothetical protein